MRTRLPLAAALLLALAACNEPVHEKSAAAAAIPVHAATTAYQTEPSFYEATGTVASRSTAVISAKWSGYVREIRVRVGDNVREGQELVTLDARDLEAASKRAAAGRDEIRSAIAEADSSLASAKSNLDLAEATYRRMSDLYEKKSISDHEFDEASASVKAARSSWDMARARRAQMDSRLSAASEEMRAADVNLGYALIRAPFAGVVTLKSADPGSLAMPGSPLLTIEGGGYRFEAQVDESKLASIHPGQEVQVTLDGTASPIGARVSEIVPAVDPASRASTVRINLPVASALRSGLFGRAAFPAGSRQVLAVPAAGVVQRGDLRFVYVVDGSVARNRLITTGAGDGGHLEVLSGLSAGERVIVPIPANLSDGAPVEVNQ